MVKCVCEKGEVPVFNLPVSFTCISSSKGLKKIHLRGIFSLSYVVSEI